MTGRESLLAFTLSAVMVYGCQSAPSPISEKDRETMNALASLGEEVELTANAEKAAIIIDGIPSWVDGTYEKAEVEALVTAARELQKLRVQDVRAAVASRSRPGEGDRGLESSGKVYVLLRVFFDVPESMEFAEAKVFGGWRFPGAGDTGRPFPARWPVTVTEGRVVSVDRFRGYAGAPYAGGAEFDFFSAKWGKRELP